MDGAHLLSSVPLSAWGAETEAQELALVPRLVLLSLSLLKLFTSQQEADLMLTWGGAKAYLLRRGIPKPSSVFVYMQFGAGAVETLGDKVNR